jgi:RNA polymerase sigma-70 factor (ECF subfamily)
LVKCVVTPEGADPADAALHRRLLAGDADALADAYDAHASAVLGVAFRMLRDQAAAQDVAQDVFVDLWARPERYDPARGRLRHWLCTTARHRVIDLLRRADVGARCVRLLANDPPWLDDDPAETAVRSAARKAVREAVESLPETYRVPLILAYYGGLTYREVARTLGLPEGTTKSRLRWAMQRLAERLAADGLAD